jgi:hypothetical protein
VLRLCQVDGWRAHNGGTRAPAAAPSQEAEAALRAAEAERVAHEARLADLQRQAEQRKKEEAK